jgi:hypothetical protein
MQVLIQDISTIFKKVSSVVFILGILMITINIMKYLFDNSVYLLPVVTNIFFFLHILRESMCWAFSQFL